MKILSAVVAALVVQSTYGFAPSARRSLMSRLASTETSTSSTSDEAAAVENKYNLDPAFEAARQKAEQTLKAAVPSEKMIGPLLHFSTEYLSANQASFKAGNKEAAPDKSVGRILNAINLGMKNGFGENKYQFSSTHRGLRGNPDEEDGNEVDFYSFGVDFFKPCMDIEKTAVMGMDNLNTAMEQIKNGENVVFLANHQSEADPQVMSVCLEKVGFGEAAAGVTFVAGHKVTTDTLAIPFSMGRNLICIHSKKHIDADPDTKSGKQRQNLKAMGGMLNLLKQGGCALWVAPSGGRDRRDLDTGKVPIAPFDSKTVDMFRLMGNKSKKPTHYYPLAMVTYDLCPPPDTIEAGTGEQRNVRYVPVGISVGDELVSEGGLEGRHEFCAMAEKKCDEDYQELLKILGTEE